MSAHHLPLSRAKAAEISIEYPPNSSKMMAKEDGDIVVIGCRKKHNTCELKGVMVSGHAELKHLFLTAVSNNDMRLVHKRRCHANVNILEEMGNNGAANGISGA